MVQESTILLSNTEYGLAVTIAAKMPGCDDMLGQRQDGERFGVTVEQVQGDIHWVSSCLSSLARFVLLSHKALIELQPCLGSN